MRTLETGSGGSVVVELPDHMRAAPSAQAPGDRRAAPADEAAGLGPQPRDAALEAALAASGFDLAADVGLWPDERAGTRAEPGEAPRVRVGVGPGESALLLVEGEGGTFGWVRPDAAEGGRRRGAAGEVTFTLSASAAPAAPGRRGSFLGWLAEVLTRPVRVRVLKFVVRLTIDVAVDRIEGGNATGLVALADKVPERWRPGPRALLPAAPEGRPARVLLMVHGTFSSTAGSFGQLVTHPAGEAFLDAAFARYDAVLGFDHKTLAETVETNAEAFADALAGLPAGTEVDAVAFSRGGLVLRVLAEELFPARRPDVRFGKVVFVGCTNAGTHLAEPDNWEALANLYTNAIMAAARLVTGFAGGALDPLVSLGIKTLGEFVQYLAQVGVGEGRVPGLASMEPDGATVRRLNAATGKAAHPPAYYAVTSNFAPRFEPSKGLSHELVQLLLDKVTNRLWRGADNDLVVDTASMAAFGTRAPRLEADGVFAFGAGEVVYHTIYFGAAETCRHLVRSLGLEPQAMAHGAPEAGEKVAARPAPAAIPEGWREGSRRRDKLSTSFGASGHEDKGLSSGGRRGGFAGAIPEALAPGRFPDLALESLTVPPRPPVAEPESAPAPEAAAAEAPLSCNVAAAMPEAPSLGAPAELEVTVSREAIIPAPGAAHAAGIIAIRSSRKLRIQAVAKANCVIDGASEEEIDPPGEGRPATLVFKVRGTAAGPAEVWVNVFQGALRLTRLVIQPRFVADGLIAVAAPVRSEDPDPPMVDLRIYEERLVGGGWRLRFVARSDELGFDYEYPSPEIPIDKTAYVKDLYKELEQAWADTDGAFDALMRRVRAAGVELFRALFPEALQRVLWDKREHIGSIQVFSGEPSIPWEVAHLVEPGKPVPLSGGAFLAELGLTRWSTNVGLAPVRLRLRPGKALYCAPDYLDPTYRLQHVPAEVEMVTSLLGAVPVDGHSEPVLKVLGRAEGIDYDVLHFACHGSSDPERVWNCGLLLGGIVRQNRVAREELTVNEVRSYANLASGGFQPIVFLNACQSGVGGYALSGAGGLAQAFVQGGAGLFVGSLWSIGDRPALTFSRTFYEALQAGRTVSAAMRQAREAAKKDNDATWLAYTVYGHPYARVTA